MKEIKEGWNSDFENCIEIKLYTKLKNNLLLKNFTVVYDFFVLSDRKVLLYKIYKIIISFIMFFLIS